MEKNTHDLEDVFFNQYNELIQKCLSFFPFYFDFQKQKIPYFLDFVKNKKENNNVLLFKKYFDLLLKKQKKENDVIKSFEIYQHFLSLSIEKDYFEKLDKNYSFPYQNLYERILIKLKEEIVLKFIEKMNWNKNDLFTYPINISLEDFLFCFANFFSEHFLKFLCFSSKIKDQSFFESLKNFLEIPNDVNFFTPTSFLNIRDFVFRKMELRN
jgi:hypothetical protein